MNIDLEQQIAEWRQRMLAAGIQSPVPLEELEEHLREEIGRLTKAGMGQVDVFEMAVGKIGQGQALKAEFTKVGAMERPVRWEQYAVFGVWFFGMVPVAVYALHKYDMSRGWWLAGWANIGVVTLAILGCRYINTLFPVIPNQRVRRVIGISAAAAGMAGMIIFMNFMLPHFSLTEGQLTVMVLWGLTLMLTGGVVLTGLEEAVINDRQQH